MYESTTTVTTFKQCSGSVTFCSDPDADPRIRTLTDTAPYPALFFSTFKTPTKSYFFSERDNNLSRSVVRYELGVGTQLIFFFLSGWK